MENNNSQQIEKEKEEDLMGNSLEIRNKTGEDNIHQNMPVDVDNHSPADTL